MKPPPVRRLSKSHAAAEQDPQVALRQGFLVANKYGLIEPLGTGSMGAVWKASHVMLGHMVAIKFLHASIEAYPEGRVRFEREAKLSARLGESSRHICRVTDYGVIGSGTPFVVMELLQGEELSTRLRRERQLPLPLIVEIVAQLCRALNVAHHAGVIHRDLKPANVFLCNPEDDDQEILVKLLDFGVAKAVLEHEDTQGTRAGTIFGTPGYMSPEQIVADAELDARSDLWSLAVMAYRMAVGRTPFGAGGLSELGLRILSTNPALPSTLRPDLPKGFDEWMKKGLAKRRDDRFASASELSNALVHATGTPASEPPADDARALDEASVAEESTYKALYSSQASPPPLPSRSRRLLPVIAGAVVLAAAAVALVSARGVKNETAMRQRTTLAESAAAQPSARSLEIDPSPPQPSLAGAQPPPAEPIASAAPLPELSNPPDAPPPTSSASGTPALRKRPTPRASKPVPRAGAVEKRATELWNKKDEL